MEMAATEEMRDIALRLNPKAVCIVPERREERTTEGGLDVAGLHNRLVPIQELMHMHLIRKIKMRQPISSRA